MGTIFNGWVILAACIGAMGAIFVVQWAGARRMSGLERLAMWVGLSCSLYCIVTGMYLAMDWVDPLANASSEEIAQHTHRRGSAFVVLLIRIWPYFLIGMGGWLAWHQAMILRRLYRTT